jgi:hypothetical protein
MTGVSNPYALRHHMPLMLNPGGKSSKRANRVSGSQSKRHSSHRPAAAKASASTIALFVYHGALVTEHGKSVREGYKEPENHCLIELTDRSTGECVLAGWNTGGGGQRMVKFATYGSGFCSVHGLDHRNLVASIYQADALRDPVMLRRAAQALKLARGEPQKHYPIPN